MATRPTLEMALAETALKSAREVSANVSVPGLYREADEAMMQAKREYQFKNFKEALEFAEKARVLAERAELLAVLKGTQRQSIEMEGGAPPPPPPL